MSTPDTDHPAALSAWQMALDDARRQRREAQVAAGRNASGTPEWLAHIALAADLATVIAALEPLIVTLESARTTKPAAAGGGL